MSFDSQKHECQTFLEFELRNQTCHAYFGYDPKLVCFVSVWVKCKLNFTSIWGFLHIASIWMTSNLNVQLRLSTSDWYSHHCCECCLFSFSKIKVQTSSICCRGLREGMQMLCRAYNSNPLHPGVLNLLAHFSLLRGELEKVILVKSRLPANTWNSSKLRSRVMYISRIFVSIWGILSRFSWNSFPFLGVKNMLLCVHTYLESKILMAAELLYFLKAWCSALRRKKTSLVLPYQISIDSDLIQY